MGNYPARGRSICVHIGSPSLANIRNKNIISYIETFSEMFNSLTVYRKEKKINDCKAPSNIQAEGLKGYLPYRMI